MDTARGFDDPMNSGDEFGIGERPLSIGTDERRMHVRAYNHWVSLLHGRDYPSIEDLEPERIADFGPHSVLLDFSHGVEDPAILYLGRALREECGVDSSIRQVSQVPSRSLLSRLTDHYLQIIANRAPVGFEAEFVSHRGRNTMYRGILMPFASDQQRINFIYGVINWKELVDPATQAKLNDEVDAALRAAPRPAPTTPVWADGPSAGLSDEMADGSATMSRPDEADRAALNEQLSAARESAAAALAAETRSRAALYRALCQAHDFSLAAASDPTGYAALLADAGIKAQERAPMTAVAKLVFGADYDEARLAEFAAVLAYALERGIRQGALVTHLEGMKGGIKGAVSAEREARQSVDRPARDARRLRKLGRRPALADVAVDAESDWVVLVARREGAGRYAVVGRLPDDERTARLLRRTV